MVGEAGGQKAFREGELLAKRGRLKSAVSRYRKSADAGSVLGQLALGNAYAAGRGVKRDRREAARWYRMAYRNGLVAGAVNLAVDLERQGNRRGAISWLRKAAALNDGSACLRLAKLYLHSRRCRAHAARLLRRAIALSPSEISEDEKQEAISLLKLCA
jgi:TPR repeat protein